MCKIIWLNSLDMLFHCSVSFSALYSLLCPQADDQQTISGVKHLNIRWRTGLDIVLLYKLGINLQLYLSKSNACFTTNISVHHQQSVNAFSSKYQTLTDQITDLLSAQMKFWIDVLYYIQIQDKLWLILTKRSK